MVADAKYRHAICPLDKAQTRFTDTSGRYLEKSPAGSKRWFWKIFANGKEGRLALGPYPCVMLQDCKNPKA